MRVSREGEIRDMTHHAGAARRRANTLEGRKQTGCLDGCSIGGSKHGNDIFEDTSASVLDGAFEISIVKSGVSTICSGPTF